MACVFVCAAVFPAFAGTPAEDAHLHFNKDGRFRILNFSDIQDDESLDSRVTTFIRQAVYAACPDLIVLTGDNIYGSDVGSGQTATAIAQFMNVFENLGVPVAIVFGNHDDNGKALTKEEQMAIYSTYSVNVSYDEGSGMAGCGTYNVPIYGSTETDKVKFNLWMFDTGSSINNSVSGLYDYMRPNQLNWYVNKSNELKAANGGVPVPSIAFQHIIVNEIYDALTPVSSGTSGSVSHNGGYYVLPDTALPGSVLGEHPCPSGNANETEFSVLKQQGDVIAIVSGHDHKNCFIVPYQGIDLINSPAAGFYETTIPVLGTVLYGGDPATRGARIIDVYEEKKSGSYYDRENNMLILRDLAKSETYMPTGATLDSYALREAYFRADRHMKLHADTVYSPETLEPFENAMQQAAAIIADLDDDHRSSRYDQMTIDQAAQALTACLEYLEPAWFTLTFDANFGTCEETSRKVFCGSAVGTLPVAQREGFFFSGWYTMSFDGDNQRITSETVFDGMDDVTVHARWSRDPNYRIPGDVDCDGTVELLDLILIQRYLVGGWALYAIRLDMTRADVNADDKIDLRDVMLLRRYLAGWKVTLV
jgi:hypothetical protein